MIDFSHNHFELFGLPLRYRIDGAALERTYRALQGNVQKLHAADAVEVVRGDALKYASSLDAGTFDFAFADPPYGTGAAEGLAEIFLERRFAQQLWIEHRAGDPLPAAAGAETRRYGDTALTFIPALE